MQLDVQAQVGCDCHRLCVHVHQPRLVLDDRTRKRPARAGLRHHKLSHHRSHDVHLRTRVWYVNVALSHRKTRVAHKLLAFGPLFLGPLSEIFGRSRVLQIANLWYLGKFAFIAVLNERAVHAFRVNATALLEAMVPSIALGSHRVFSGGPGTETNNSAHAGQPIRSHLAICRDNAYLRFRPSLEPGVRLCPKYRPADRLPSPRWLRRQRAIICTLHASFVVRPKLIACAA